MGSWIRVPDRLDGADRVQPVYLMDLAARHAQWASTRQTTVASNIANVNTPGYEAVDIVPFSDVLDKTALVMAQTQSGHMSFDGSQSGDTKVNRDGTWDVTHSGNSVSLDKEMLKAADISAAFAFDNNVIRSFHRMLLSTAKTGA